MNKLISEVESNKESIEAGFNLIYIDNSNCMNWRVTDIFEGGFEAKNDYETQDFYFNELQLGWKISQTSKIYIKSIIK